MSPLVHETSQSRKYSVYYTGLSTAIHFEVDSTVKGCDIYTVASIFQGLWFLFSGLYVNAILFLPSFAYSFTDFKLAWTVTLLFSFFLFLHFVHHLRVTEHCLCHGLSYGLPEQYTLRLELLYLLLDFCWVHYGRVK